MGNVLCGSLGLGPKNLDLLNLRLAGTLWFWMDAPVTDLLSPTFCHHLYASTSFIELTESFKEVVIVHLTPARPGFQMIHSFAQQDMICCL